MGLTSIGSFLFVVLAFSALSLPAKAIDVFFAKNLLVLVDGQRRITIPDQADEYAFYQTLHAVQKRGQVYYVVFGTSQWSRGGPPKSGNCGAGIESLIKWLKIEDGRVIAEQEGRYESCIQNRYDWSIRWINGKLVWTSIGLREFELFGQREYGQAAFSWSFDPARPDDGITEVVEKHTDLSSSQATP